MSINYKIKYIEDNDKHFLLKKTPVIIRIDGKAFSNYTKRFERPFDRGFRAIMEQTAFILLQQIQGAVCAYTQSDEISILVTDYAKENSDCWLGYNQQKVVSVSASIATAEFNNLVRGLSKYSFESHNDLALFDARAFNIEKETLYEYFMYRRSDGERNFINTLGRCVYSQKAINGVSAVTLEEMVKTENPDLYNKFNIPVYRYGCFIFVTKNDDGDKVINSYLPEDTSAIREVLDFYSQDCYSILGEGVPFPKIGN